MEPTINDLVALFFMQMHEAQGTALKMYKEAGARGEEIAKRDVRIEELEKGVQTIAKDVQALKGAAPGTTAPPA